MAEVAIDGGGVLPEQPLPDGTRVVFRTGASGSTAITVYVERDRLILKGQYGTLIASQMDENTVQVRTIPPFYKRGEVYP